jgi:NADH:ubiquinone reductase (H+-translocating)
LGLPIRELVAARLSRQAVVADFSLATIGKRLAVIDFGRVKLRGALAWWIWGFAHIYFLIGLRNRLSVILNWLWIHIRDQRSGRLITQGRYTGSVRAE